MKKIIFLSTAFTIGYSVSGQLQTVVKRIDTTVASEKYWTTWFKDLYEPGVVMDRDSIKVNDEGQKIIIDPEYRKSIYPNIYTWEAAIMLMNQMELKKAFWYLINLYAIDTGNKKKVINVLVPLEQALDVKKAMTGSFYTYVFFDPRNSEIRNGKPVILRPDQLEREFEILKEILSYIEYYRNQQKPGPKKE